MDMFLTPSNALDDFVQAMQANTGIKAAGDTLLRSFRLEIQKQAKSPVPFLLTFERFNILVDAIQRFERIPLFLEIQPQWRDEAITTLKGFHSEYLSLALHTLASDSKKLEQAHAKDMKKEPPFPFHIQVKSTATISSFRWEMLFDRHVKTAFTVFLQQLIEDGTRLKEEHRDKDALEFSRSVLKLSLWVMSIPLPSTISNLRPQEFMDLRTMIQDLYTDIVVLCLGMNMSGFSRNMSELDASEREFIFVLRNYQSFLYQRLLNYQKTLELACYQACADTLKSSAVKDVLLPSRRDALDAKTIMSGETPHAKLLDEEKGEDETNSDDTSPPIEDRGRILDSATAWKEAMTTDVALGMSDDYLSNPVLGDAVREHPSSTIQTSVRSYRNFRKICQTADKFVQWSKDAVTNYSDWLKNERRRRLHLTIGKRYLRSIDAWRNSFPLQPNIAGLLHFQHTLSLAIGNMIRIEEQHFEPDMLLLETELVFTSVWQPITQAYLPCILKHQQAQLPSTTEPTRLPGFTWKTQASVLKTLTIMQVFAAFLGTRSRISEAVMEKPILVYEELLDWGRVSPKVPRGSFKALKQHQIDMEEFLRMHRAYEHAAIVFGVFVIEESKAILEAPKKEAWLRAVTFLHILQRTHVLLNHSVLFSRHPRILLPHEKNLLAEARRDFLTIQASVRNVLHTTQMKLIQAFLPFLEDMPPRAEEYCALLPSKQDPLRAYYPLGEVPSEDHPVIAALTNDIQLKRNTRPDPQRYKDIRNDPITAKRQRLRGGGAAPSHISTGMILGGGVGLLLEDVQ